MACSLVGEVAAGGAYERVVVYYLDSICDPESLQFSAYVRAVRSVGSNP